MGEEGERKKWDGKDGNNTYVPVRHVPCWQPCGGASRPLGPWRGRGRWRHLVNDEGTRPCIAHTAHDHFCVVDRSANCSTSDGWLIEWLQQQWTHYDLVFTNPLLNTWLIICPIAIAYSMGQIIKSVCVFQCVCVCVRLRALSRSHFLIDFHQNWHRRENPDK